MQQTATSTAVHEDDAYRPLFPLGPDQTAYRRVFSDGIAVERVGDRQFLTVHPVQCRFVVEQVLLCRTAGLKQVNDPFRLGRKVGPGGFGLFTRNQTRQGRSPNPSRTSLKKDAPVDGKRMLEV